MSIDEVGYDCHLKDAKTVSLPGSIPLVRHALKAVGPAAQTLGAILKLSGKAPPEAKSSNAYYGDPEPPKRSTFSRLSAIAETAGLPVGTVRCHLRTLTKVKPEGSDFPWVVKIGREPLGKSRRLRRTVTYRLPGFTMKAATAGKFNPLPKWAFDLPSWSLRSVVAFLVSQQLQAAREGEANVGREFCSRRQILAYSGLTAPAARFATDLLVDCGILTKRMGDVDELKEFAIHPTFELTEERELPVYVVGYLQAGLMARSHAIVKKEKSRQANRKISTPQEKNLDTLDPGTISTGGGKNLDSTQEKSRHPLYTNPCEEPSIKNLPIQTPKQTPKQTPAEQAVVDEWVSRFGRLRWEEVQKHAHYIADNIRYRGTDGAFIWKAALKLTFNELRLHDVDQAIYATFGQDNERALKLFVDALSKDLGENTFNAISELRVPRSLADFRPTK